MKLVARVLFASLGAGLCAGAQAADLSKVAAPVEDSVWLLAGTYLTSGSCPPAKDQVPVTLHVERAETTCLLPATVAWRDERSVLIQAEKNDCSIPATMQWTASAEKVSPSPTGTPVLLYFEPRTPAEQALKGKGQQVVDCMRQETTVIVKAGSLLRPLREQLAAKR